MVNYSNLEQHLQHIAREMYTYQREAVSALDIRPKCMLESKAGSGKTLITLTTTAKRKPNRILIICGTNAFYTWKKELDKWFPGMLEAGDYIVVGGKGIQKAKRMKQWASNCFAYVTTCASACNDMDTILAKGFKHVIIDEWHTSGLRNYKSTRLKQLKPIIEAADYYIPLSASPISKGPHQFWPNLNIMDPKMFSSYWKFFNTFCLVDDNGFGKQVLGSRNAEGLAQLIKPYHYLVVGAEKEMPKIVRQTIDIDMEPEQLEQYREMVEDSVFRAPDGTLTVARTAVEVPIRLRQLLCSPKILGFPSWGAALWTIKDKMEELEDPHAVIFTMFRPAMEIYGRFFREHYPKAYINIIAGGVTMDEIRDRCEAFRRRRGIMICTTQYAQSYELETADNCFHVSYSYDQNDNYQAESRLARVTRQGKPVNSYYIKHRDPDGGEESVDDRVLQLLDHKTITVQQAYAHINKDKSK